MRMFAVYCGLLIIVHICPFILVVFLVLLGMQREASSGVGRLKWDAKVRMKQAKLRAAGENRSREEVIQVIVEDSVEAAQHGVVERFDEIAKERGFHDNENIGERQHQSNVGTSSSNAQWCIYLESHVSTTVGRRRLLSLVITWPHSTYSPGARFCFCRHKARDGVSDSICLPS